MGKLSRIRPSQLPLRIRLTLWYTFSLGLILFLFATFLYLQVRRSLFAQVDAALSLAAAQALINLDDEAEQLAFQVEGNPGAIRRLNDDFVIYLRGPEGRILDTLSNEDSLPQFLQVTGFQTLLAEGELWRVYNQEVAIGDQRGQLQVAQELDLVNSILANLQAQLLLGLPLALLLAGLGGYFLASRALRPVDRITQTAQAISASDLDQRIHYRGPADEIGRLASTLDNMLDRLQGAFVRERRFTGDAAHELRTPLAGLKGRIGVTLSQPRQAEAYAETLHDMEGQVDRLIRLSNDLLLMARLDQGQLRPQVDTIILSDFLSAVVDQVRPLTEAKSISLTTTIPPDLTIQGDLDLLIRLHLNLLDNAVKYTPPGGRVAVEAEGAERYVAISISDNGPGIPAEHLPRLFDRFYRVESDRSRAGRRPEVHGGQSALSPGWRDDGRGGGPTRGGAGLGLAIAYEIARAHGGELSVQSEVDQGTTFMVRLPAISPFES